jgi:hypothetical protein
MIGSAEGCSCGSSARVIAPDVTPGSDAGASEAGPDGGAPPAEAGGAQPEGGPDSGVDATVSAEAGTDSGTDATGPTDAGAEASACALSDGGTGTLCPSGCTSLASDPANCGACGMVCEAGAVCASMACQNVAGSLSGLRWQLPCTSPSNGINCPSSVDGSAEEVLTTTLSGSTGTTYQVTLHFRGEVEEKTYDDFDGGVATSGEPPGDAGDPQFFISGGSPDNSTWNIYELDISDPPQTYYLNSGMDGINDTWLVDYLATIPMAAGATITLTANTVEGVETSNQGPDGGPIYVPGVPPYPAAYNGQFVQMDIVSVTPIP